MFKVKVNDVQNDILKVTIIEKLKEVYRYNEAPDLEFIQDQAINFFKNQTLKNAILDSVEILESKGDFENIVHVLLEEYYDPRYQHAMRMNEYALKLSAEDLNIAAEKLVRFRSGIVSCRDNILQTAQNNQLN